MEYTNPGYAATQALQAFELNRRAQARQDMLDKLEMQRAQIELEDHQSRIQQQQEDRQRKQFQDKIANLMPGDVPDSDLMAEGQKLGMPLPIKVMEDMNGPQIEGPVQDGQQPLHETSRVYLGSPQFRMEQMKTAQAKAQATAKAQALAAIDHTKPETFEAAMQAGATPAEIKSVIESRSYTDPNAPVPIVRIGRDGKLQTLGEAPKNAHFQNEPTPVNVNVGQGGVDSLSDETLNFMADRVLAGGDEPAFGSGTQGAIARQKFQTALAKRAAALGLTAEDVLKARMRNKADTGSLTAMTKNSDAVKSFMAAADANAGPGGIDALLEKVPDSGFAIVNKVWRPIRSNVTDEAQSNMAAFNAYIQSLKNEYARITSQPNLAGQLTDTARKEMETVINDNSTIPQIKGVLNALRNEGMNRERAMDAGIEAILGRTGNGNSNKPSAEDLWKKYGTPGGK